MITVEILADSISETTINTRGYEYIDEPTSLCGLGNKYNRLTTVVATFPRIILGEVNTHKMISKNSASSRAIPFSKNVSHVRDNPFVPSVFQKPHKGMQGDSQYTGEDEAECAKLWVEWRDMNIDFAQRFNKVKPLTKQLLNRPLEAFSMHTAILSGTDWENFFALRAHPAAECHFQELAYAILRAMNESEPVKLKPGEFHLPYGDTISRDDLVRAESWVDEAIAQGNPFISSLVSLRGIKRREVAKIVLCNSRIATVSYLNQTKTEVTEADFDRTLRMWAEGHWSPSEHIGTPQRLISRRSGNFWGFTQLRKMFPSYMENKKDPRLKRKMKNG